MRGVRNHNYVDRYRPDVDSSVCPMSVFHHLSYHLHQEFQVEYVTRYECGGGGSLLTRQIFIVLTANRMHGDNCELLRASHALRILDGPFGLYIYVNPLEP
jgi:hypothetical protein